MWYGHAIASILAAAVLVAAGCGAWQPNEPAGDVAALNGVYRNTMTFDEYIAAGVDRSWATANAGTGVHTMRLHDGRAIDEVRGTATPACRAHYTVHAHTIRWVFDQAPGCGGYLTATWSLQNGELRFAEVKSDDAGGRAEFGLKLFRKIG